MSVYYKSSILSVSLIEHYFMFNMDNESKRTLTDPTKYVNAQLYGTYSHRMSIGDDIRNNKHVLFREFLDKKNGVKVGANKTEENEGDEEVSKEVLEYDYMFDEHEYKESSYISGSCVKKLFITLCGNPKFNDLVSVILSARDKERRENAGIDEEFHDPETKNAIMIRNDEDVMARFKDALTL